MKHVAQEEIVSAVPMPPVMTRRQKLERWADLISQHTKIDLVHDLEHWSRERFEYPLSYVYTNTAFCIAAGDPTFKKMGLIDTVASAMNFFEIDRDELHEFTCDCHGPISSKRMARRIRYIANPTFFGRFGR